MLVKQNLTNKKIDNIEKKVEKELEKLNIKKIFPKNSIIGITAGSRGIKDIVIILKSAINYLESNNFKPKIVVGMGSHGGGTSQGQLEVLNSLGINEKTMGVEILTGEKVKEIGKTDNGLTAYTNENVDRVDGIILINRIKAHTALSEDIQSGLIKKAVVGLGGPLGAKQFHSLKFKNLTKSIKSLGQVVLDNTNIIGGLAILEDAYENTHSIIGLKKEEFFIKEPKLLKKSMNIMPILPFEKIDLLIIQEMGKNFSGTGIDSNIIRRNRIQDSKNDDNSISRIVVLDLTNESHGNANGIGLADFTTEKLVNKIDFKTTYLNIMTSRFIQRGFIPLVFKNDKEAIEKAINSLSLKQKNNSKIVIIPNTLELEYILISKSLKCEAIESNNEIIDDNIKIEFNENDELNIDFKGFRK
jgi:hypothetical protein